MMTTISRR